MMARVTQRAGSRSAPTQAFGQESLEDLVWAGEQWIHPKMLRHITVALWRDIRVVVFSERPCSGHQLQGIDNYGTPTGMLWCVLCEGAASEPEEPR